MRRLSLTLHLTYSTALGSAPATAPGYKTASRGLHPTPTAQTGRTVVSTAVPVVFGFCCRDLRRRVGAPATVSGYKTASRGYNHRSPLSCPSRFYRRRYLPIKQSAAFGNCPEAGVLEVRPSDPRHKKKGTSPVLHARPRAALPFVRPRLARLPAAATPSRHDGEGLRKTTACSQKSKATKCWQGCAGQGGRGL